VYLFHFGVVVSIGFFSSNNNTKEEVLSQKLLFRVQRESVPEEKRRND
jgi:hypothetical protein